MADLSTWGYAILGGLLPSLIWLYFLLKESAGHPEAASLLEAFGLAGAGGKRVKAYSGGMRRRLDLAAHGFPQPARLRNVQQLPAAQTLRFDEAGKDIGQPRETGRIEDVSDSDKEYMERMKDEYAKREGGA